MTSSEKHILVSMEDGTYRPEQYEDGMVSRIQDGVGEGEGSCDTSGILIVAISLTVLIIVFVNKCV
jgi:hypothetical protein